MPITTGQEAFNALLDDPEHFLNHNLLRVGAQVDVTGIAQNFFIYNTLMTFRDETPQFAIDNNNPGFGDPFEFNTTGIATTMFDTLTPPPPPNDLPAIQLPRPQERQLLITARVGGCTIVFQEGFKLPMKDSGPFIAHIQPSGEQKGEALETALVGSMFEDSDIKTFLYGAFEFRSASVSDTASAIGVFTPNSLSWTMYFQIIDNIPAPKGIRRVDSRRVRFDISP